MADIKKICIRDNCLDNCIHLLDDVADGSLRGNTAGRANKGSIAVGTRANASGENSQSFGINTTASGDASHAEGTSTTASGAGSHTEGYNTLASGTSSHAEGQATTASGEFSHSEGAGTIASGSFSHAEGRLTEAIGDFSHASGDGSVARGRTQFVIGRNNFIDNEDAFVFIIGKGTDSSWRSNAMSVDWSGNTAIAGTLTQGSDRELKEHIDYLGDDAVEFVRGLKPANFKKDGAEHLGFYAQDVEEIDKWDCLVGEMNGYKTLGYIDLIAPLVAYCQSLEERTEKLEKRIAKLEKGAKKK